MSVVSQIKKSFVFLKDYKFKRKIYSEIADYEIVYYKEDLEISIYYSLCVSDSLVKECGNDYKRLFAESYFTLGIMIQKGKDRSNILNCMLFSIEERNLLNDTINKVPKKNILELIEVYSNFLKRNMNNLINC